MQTLEEIKQVTEGFYFGATINFVFVKTVCHS